MISSAAVISFGAKSPGVINGVQADWRSQMSTTLSPHTPLSRSSPLNTDSVNKFLLYLGLLIAKTNKKTGLFIILPQEKNNTIRSIQFKKRKWGGIHQQM